MTYQLNKNPNGAVVLQRVDASGIKELGEVPDEYGEPSLMKLGEHTMLVDSRGKGRPRLVDMKTGKLRLVK
jgi:hypothetical protein